MDQSEFKGEFEKGWQKALDGAEASPSPSSWSAIESELIAAENQTMRRKVVFYQRLAAASIIFAALIGASAFYYYRNDAESSAQLAALKSTPDNRSAAGTSSDVSGSVSSKGTELAGVTNDEDDAQLATSEGKITDNTISTRNITSSNEPSASSIGIAQKQVSLTGTHELQSNSPGVHQDQAITTGTSRFVEFLANQTGLRADDRSKNARVFPLFIPKGNSAKELTSNEQVNLLSGNTTQPEEVESPIKIQKKKEETIVPETLQASVEEKKETKKSKSYTDELWASVSMSAGSYTPSVATASPPVVNTISGRPPKISNDQNSPGSSYSLGIAMGKRVAEKWVVLTGLNYMNQSTGYASNVVTVSNTASSNQATSFVASQTVSDKNVPVAFSGNYSVNSTLEYVSLPVQAGYLMVDKKIGFQMNAGMAADFFLRNTLRDESGQASSFTQSAGSGSPYRSVNLAGLVSTEVSYKLARQYRVSLVPGMRYALNPSFKSGVGNPYVLDIGFRFKYILK